MSVQEFVLIKSMEANVGPEDQRASAVLRMPTAFTPLQPFSENAFVSVETRERSEILPTLWTEIWSFSCVDVLVTLQMTLSLKAHSTL